MKKGKSSQSDPDMLDEYDFSNGIRGKYVERLREGSNVVKLDEDVAAIFTTEKAVITAYELKGKPLLAYRRRHIRKGTRR